LRERFEQKSREKRVARKTAKGPDGKIGLIVAVGGALGVIGFGLARAFSRARASGDHGHSAAFAPDETDQANFDQTRHAGTVAMRDTPQNWDEIDEQLDASFPSSDPPSFNPGIA
jgi:hypothetical protein